MRTLLSLSVLSVVLLAVPATSNAGTGTCTIQSVTEGCDRNCSSTSCPETGVTCNQCDQIYGDSDGLCVICGTAGDDTIDPDCINAWVCGGDGDDDLSGAKFLNGEGGDDTIHPYGGSDSVGEGGPGNDTMTSWASASLYGGPGDDTLSVPNVVGGYDTDIWGGTGNDIITGEDGDDRLYGGPGNDTIDGRGGADELVGGAGNDLLRGGPGNDKLWACGDGDVLHGEGGGDELRGEDGSCENTTAATSELGTVYCGGSGNDDIYAVGENHQCVDGGDGGADDCDWDDIRGGEGSEANCETLTGDTFDYEESTDNVFCGCS